MATHKYAAVINAWAYGKEIQCKSKSGKTWIDYDGISRKGETPAFASTDIDWRIKPKIVKREGWVNVYPVSTPDFFGVYVLNSTKEEADSRTGKNRIACIRIEWEEEV